MFSLIILFSISFLDIIHTSFGSAWPDLLSLARLIVLFVFVTSVQYRYCSLKSKSTPTALLSPVTSVSKCCSCSDMLARSSWCLFAIIKKGWLPVRKKCQYYKAKQIVSLSYSSPYWLLQQSNIYIFIDSIVLLHYIYMYMPNEI